MMTISNFKIKGSVLTALLLGMQLCGIAQIRLPKLIGDGMVLQRGDSVKVWGWASPLEKISVDFIGKNYRTVADGKGEWLLKIEPQKAGGPYQMTLIGNNKIVLKDILYGDVWLCSGQSNMELDMNRLVDRYPNEIAASTNGKIRQFLVPDEYDFSQVRADFSTGSWKSANPNTVLNFSGVGYFFAKEIFAKYKVPIGIINAALGGSPAQAWISEQGLEKFPSYFDELQYFKSQKLIDSIQKQEAEKNNQWYSLLDKSDKGLKQGWRANDQIAKDWPQITMPASFASVGMGKVNGVVWLKKEFFLTSMPTAKEAKLLLGTLRDADSTFVNGNFVGSTSYFYPPRRYLFALDLLKQGRNTITVRLVVNNGNAEFIRDKPYHLIIGKDTISVAGNWSYALGVQSDPAPSSTFFRWKSAGLYNGMIAPLKNYSIKAAVWYQGESNTGNPGEYGALMQTLIADWRKTFGKPELPFLYVQLPNFMEAKEMPSESGWAEMREQQRQLSTVPWTAMATTIDLGEWNDIHPLNKKDVAVRLALQARKLVYKEKVQASGPVFGSVKRVGDKLVIVFSETGKGLVAKGGELKGFAIAGSDNRFIWAEARISGRNTVVVSSSKVSDPVKIRYAWADNPEGANLYNDAGLPASPFQAELDPRK